MKTCSFRCHLAAPIFALLIALMPTSVSAEPLPSIEEKTAGMEKQEGFIPVYWDADTGDVWIEVDRSLEPFLYYSTLSAGLGSNDIGLDRGLLGEAHVVRFERVGRKLLLVASNQSYRASTDNEAERRAVREAFAESVLWGFEIHAATGERVLARATDFVTHDAMGIVARLKGAGQGAYSKDASGSAPYRPGIKAFPRNTELEGWLTFTSADPGRLVATVAPDAGRITLRQRLSLVALPEPGYEPRAYVPGSGYFAASFVDYAQPVSEPKERRFIARHRLEKKDPSAAIGEPVEPIVYYLDPGTPEPIRSALLEGASWWNEAFEAAGFRDAFRVEMLPEDADPLDVRYNVIQWVHRSTRGWSYGRSVIDPRTGEILKGVVSLGSLRVRQDYLLAEGLLAPYEGSNVDGYPPENDPMLAMALARLRQLSAHEVGHTLGLAHNFAASINDRASVMDYPAPLVTLGANDRLDLSKAYDTGIGEWDRIAIRYGYADFPEGTDQAAALEGILDEAASRGLLYLSDDDARPAGGAHPAAHLWDNGVDPVRVLDEQMAVRRWALERFGERNLPSGRPMATLEEVLVPLYLHHRYQIEAVSKLVGGVDYRHAVRGEAATDVRRVDGVIQREALHALLRALRPEALRLPAEAMRLIGARPPEYEAGRELFADRGGPVFDAYGPAAVVAEMVLALLLHRDRAARLVYQHDLDDSLPSLLEVLDVIDTAVFDPQPDADAYDAELARIVQQTWVNRLMRLAGDREAAAEVRARAQHALRERRGRLSGERTDDAESEAHRMFLVDEITRFVDREMEGSAPFDPAPAPPGAPIGAGQRPAGLQVGPWFGSDVLGCDR